MPAAPKANVKTPLRPPALAAPAVSYDGEGDDTTSSPEPAQPAVAPCAFPLEMKDGRCPVAVFNSPTSPRERISTSSKSWKTPLQFADGLLAVFREEDADVVRRASRGSTYLEADPRVFEPFRCKACRPVTRWYSTDAFERHMRFKHSGS
jgi:hypothetical protein